MAENNNLFDKCKAQYGNRGDVDMVNMLLRSQLNVCSVKTTQSGHRDRFEMDLLQRLHKIRQANATKTQQQMRGQQHLTQEQAAKLQQNRDLNKMYRAYTTGERIKEQIEVENVDKKYSDGEEDNDLNEEEKEVRDFYNRTANQKYDIKKQISQLNNSDYGKFIGMPRHLLH